MKLSLLSLFVSFLCWTCSSGENSGTKEDFSSQIKEHRKLRFKSMLGEGSPLPAEEKKNFAGLNFFSVDSNFRVKAKIELTPGLQSIFLNTNTDRRAAYQPAATFTFSIGKKELVLTAYKDLETASNTLFIPFTDKTTGFSTYSSGRYLDVELPENNETTIDFNYCYNPYCAYNKKYSCPIPPANNYLDVSIEAGEKKYH